MPETKAPSQRGRTHDAAAAREAILNAAEAVFAEHGFDGARIDSIAEEANYNKSLIFQYFGDKLGLYEQVIRRADEYTREAQAQVFATLLQDDILLDLDRFKTLLRGLLNAYFNFLVEHPRLVRIILWEMAENWQTYRQILSQRDIDDVDQFKPVVQKLQDAGILRAGVNPVAQVVLTEFFVPCYLACIPLYQSLLPAEDFTSPAVLAQAREFVIDFAIRGLVMEPT